MCWFSSFYSPCRRIYFYLFALKHINTPRAHLLHKTCNISSFWPTDLAGTSCPSIQEDRDTGNLQEPPDTSLHGRKGHDHTALPLRGEGDNILHELLVCIMGMCVRILSRHLVYVSVTKAVWCHHVDLCELKCSIGMRMVCRMVYLLSTPALWFLCKQW